MAILCRMRFSCGIAACVFLLPLVAAQSLEPRLYDLSLFVRPYDPRLEADETEPYVVPSANPVPNGYAYDEYNEPGGVTWSHGVLGRRLEAGPVLEWIVDAVHAAGDAGTVRYGDFATPQRVLVEATAATHARIARRIADLEAATLRPIVVELLRLPPAAVVDLPRGAALDDTALDALLARHAPLQMWRRAARTGVPIVLRAGEMRSYLRDAEVEVATEQEIFDPKMDVLPFGLIATIRVARGPRDGAFLTCSIRRTEESPESRTIETEYAELQLPAVDFELHEVRTPLAGDGAVVLGALAEHGSVWVVVVRGLGGVRPDAVPLGGVGPLPWRGLTPSRVGARPLSVPGETFELGEDFPKTFPLPPDIAEAIDQHDETEDAPGLVIGDAWVAARESAALGRVRSLAVKHAAGAAVTVRYALCLVDAGEGARAAGADADLAALVERAVVRGVLPTREGDLAVAFAGTERAYLRDHDVEIAQGASLANPIVDTWFGGAGVRLRVWAREGGGFLVRGDVGYQRVAEGPQQLDKRAYDRGLIDAPRIDHARAEIETELAGGRWELAELVPFGRAGRHLVVLVRADG